MPNTFRSFAILAGNDLMAMHTESWFVGERSENLALVLLTRYNPSLKITKADEVHGIDYLVDLAHNGQIFGVEVKGSVGPVPSSGKSEWKKFVAKYKQIPFPVCIFAFDVQTDDGWYGWVREPVVDSAKNRSLLFHEKLTFAQLNDDEVAAIMKSVEKWYQAKR